MMREGQVEARSPISFFFFFFFFFFPHLEKLDDIGDRARHALNVQLRRLGDVVDLHAWRRGKDGCEMGSVSPCPRSSSALSHSLGPPSIRPPGTPSRRTDPLCPRDTHTLPCPSSTLP